MMSFRGDPRPIGQRMKSVSLYRHVFGQHGCNKYHCSPFTLHERKILELTTLITSRGGWY
jgi:hypothetical protein